MIPTLNKTPSASAATSGRVIPVSTTSNRGEPASLKCKKCCSVRPGNAKRVISKSWLTFSLFLTMSSQSEFLSLQSCPCCKWEIPWGILESGWYGHSDPLSIENPASLCNENTCKETKLEGFAKETRKILFKALLTIASFCRNWGRCSPPYGSNLSHTAEKSIFHIL